MLIFLKRYNGFTLLELMTTVALIALTLTVAAPALTSMAERSKARESVKLIQRQLSLARVDAVATESRVTVCPLDTNNECSSDWNSTISAFTDDDNNRVRSNDERIISSIPANLSAHILRSYNNRAISFDYRGFSGFNAGTFSYCVSGVAKFGKALIISRIGRVREGEDRDGDGLQETASGKKIPCPQH